ALQRFHGQVEATNDKLTGVYDRISQKISDDHDAALRSYERSIWVAGIAGIFSLLAMAVGVLIVGRILSASVDRLVKGAVRFAAGDRQHRIEISLPPELHRVAEEFNDMIGRIHESEEALSRLAHHDALTGLGNRRAFDEAFREVQDRKRRHGEQAALLAIDIDHFKRINDQYGHGAGDQVLRSIAGTMPRHVRPMDKVFRIGGEEFVAILPGASSDQAREIANRLREAIASAPIPIEEGAIDVSVSIGVATTAEAREQGELMELADRALYEAKTAGRNRVVVGGEGEGQVGLG
ncbi:MAG TPA: sensor domain-containing diguanylate cyclase, partial [Sphingomonadaceae bacterium]|nr:sensor domain-containing diguanylate cyclase [Sphingomonadaceae bacterium]